MYRRAISLTLFRNRSLRHGVRWTLSGEIALFTPLYRIAVNTAKNYLVAQGRRPPSSDVDANEAENFESGGALKEISNPENLMLSEELRQIVFVPLNRSRKIYAWQLRYGSWMA